MRVSDWEAALDATDPAQPSQVPAIRKAVADIARARGATRAVWTCASATGIGPLPRPDSPGLGLRLGLIAHETDGFEIRAVPDGRTGVMLRFAP